MQTLRLNRFDLLYALGRVPHEQRMATIELYGLEVIPRVRELLAAARTRHSAGSRRHGMTMAASALAGLTTTAVD